MNVWIIIFMIDNTLVCKKLCSKFCSKVLKFVFSNTNDVLVLFLKPMSLLAPIKVCYDWLQVVDEPILSVWRVRWINIYGDAMAKMGCFQLDKLFCIFDVLHFFFLTGSTLIRKKIVIFKENFPYTIWSTLVPLLLFDIEVFSVISSWFLIKENYSICDTFFFHFNNNSYYKFN